MDKWKNWSQIELNIAVAKNEGLNVVKCSVINEGAIHVIEGSTGISRLPDYCKNWAVMMPLLLRGGIIIGEHTSTGKYLAIAEAGIDNTNSICSSEITYLHEDPLIAGVIVYLISNGVDVGDRKNILN